MTAHLTNSKSKPASKRRIEEKFGCNYPEYWELKKRADKPIARFVFQRSSAKTRGVAWELSLAQWWSIWERSGFWEKRGCQSDSYCMCRHGDIGPYAVGNVFIAEFRQNSSIHPHKKSALPMGVHARDGRFRATRRINGKVVRLGNFATPELASAAYLASIEGGMVQQ